MPSPDSVSQIEKVLLALEQALLSQRLWERPAQIPLASLARREQELLRGILGEGATVVEAPGTDARTAVATSFSGVWLTGKQSGAEGLSYTIDVGLLPAFVGEKTAALPALALPPSSLASESVAAWAVLRELVEKARAWEQELRPCEINLLLHPLSPADYEQLSGFLGRGPVIGWMEGWCRWWLFATQWRNVWRIEVRSSAGRCEASLLEIGRCPAVLTFPQSAFLVSARRVRRLLELYGE
ncbi:hydrogenase expression/formation protein [Methylacidimicrobium sp. AP8]|uniref:hydrogenase expression/formation protein n=1 Tax=Methylacidimicrobium sp. AP8 TaxID=2730359 RepID=UPI001F3238E6|nr:hydrogenase expression/formation protein [Methylacidimicrobium sp. AP8]